ncbi:MAG: hypothetical protein QNJ45_23975 [Ardenticatenaceae bacterium]|nr:hypothetical protein [Ardenticatenaceae bacterium]
MFVHEPTSSFIGYFVFYVVSTSTSQGVAMYQAAVEHFQIPIEQRGVPLLVVGDVVLIGSFDIPQRFPGLIVFMAVLAALMLYL